MENVELSKNHDLVVETALADCQYYMNYADPWHEKARKCYLLDQGEYDWSHKEAHNAKLHLNKLGLARMQYVAAVKRGLMKFDEWLSVEQIPLMESELLNSFEAKRMIEILTRDSELKVFTADTVGYGFYENLICAKLVPYIKEQKAPGGKLFKSPRVGFHHRDIWTYGTDPDTKDIEKCDSMFEFDVVYEPKYKVLKRTHKKPSEYSVSKPYIHKVVKNLESYAWPEDENKDEQEDIKGDIETQTQRPNKKHLIKIVEFYGTLLDPNTGEVLKYKRSRDGKEIELENIRMTIANDQSIIEEPTPLSEIYIDGKSPFVRHRMHRVKQHILGRAPGHPGYEIARVLNEMASAAADAAMKASNQLIGVVVDSLENPEDVQGGIRYDTVLKFSEGTDIRNSVVSLSQGSLPPEFFSVQGVLESAYAENVAKTKLGLAGDLPNKQVKATELVQSVQAVQALEDSDLIDFEDVYLEKKILKTYHYGLQMGDKFHEKDLEYIFKDRGPEIKQAIEKFKKLAKNKEKMFEELAFCFRFRGRGISTVANASRQAQVMSNLMAAAFSNPGIGDFLQAQGYDFAKMQDFILEAQGVDPEEVKNPEVAARIRALQKARAFGEGLARARGQGADQGQGVRPAAGAPQGDTVPGNDGNQ